MTLTVVILAGGAATRLGETARTRPKSLVDVAGRPFIEHQLDLLRRQGATDVVLCVGHLGDQIEGAVGDGARFGLRVCYSHDGAVPLGTGGALRRALPLLGRAFFVMYGDSYLECDYGEVERAFIASGAPALLTVLRNRDRWDRSNVLCINGRIVRYSKSDRTPDMQHIDYGLAVISADVMMRYHDGESLDLATVYEELAGRGELAALEMTTRFFEIGSPAGLADTRVHLANARVMSYPPRHS